MEKQIYQRIFMFIASLVIVMNIFCSTHQAYFLAAHSTSFEQLILDSKNETYSVSDVNKSIFEIEESRIELEEEENFSDDFKGHISTSNFLLSGAIWFYYVSGKKSEPFCFIKQKFPTLFLLLENFRI